MFELDFSLLPTIIRHRVFKGMPKYIEEALTPLQMPETLDRLRSASLFLGEVSASQQDWLNRAYLRAGLSEFRSVRQALHWDLGQGEVHSPEKSRNPIVHLVYRLRRLAVYVANAPTIPREVTATIHMGQQAHSVDIKVLLIDNIERYLRLERLRNSYREEDISRLCEWFEFNQLKFGASQVLDTGVLVYCNELLDVYGKNSTVI